MPGRAKRRQSANSIIAATARIGKDVKIDYDGDGKIKSITTITPGNMDAVDAHTVHANGSSATTNEWDDL